MTNEDLMYLEARIGALEIMVFSDPKDLEMYITQLKSTIIHPANAGLPLLKTRLQNIVEILEARLAILKK